MFEVPVFQQWLVAHLHNTMAYGAILPLPKQNQADHNHSCYGHSDNEQANESAAPKAEVLSQRTEGFLLQRSQKKKTWNEEMTQLSYHNS